MGSLPQSQTREMRGETPAPGGPQSRARKGAPEPDQSDRLAQLVEGEIIPRLMLAHSRYDGADPDDVDAIDDGTVDRFAQRALSNGHESLMGFILRLLGQGVGMDAVYLELLAPAARRLGDYWNDDQASFADVTIALGRLQNVARELSQFGGVDLSAGHGDRSALFAPAPGEQHTLGLVIVEEFFRRSGWRTRIELSGLSEKVLSAVQARRYDVFGLTAASATTLEQIAPMIMSVRRGSRNRDISVLVGGRLFLEHPELVAMVGADAMAVDARDAVSKAETSVRQLARR